MTDDNDGDIDTDVTVGVLSTLKQNERKKTQVLEWVDSVIVFFQILQFSRFELSSWR